MKTTQKQGGKRHDGCDAQPDAAQLALAAELRNQTHGRQRGGVMSRHGRGHRTIDGALRFLWAIEHGLTPLELRGALCADHDPDRCLPAHGDRVDAERAKAICQRFPVRPSCLDGGLTANERIGMEAGTTPNERRALSNTDAESRPILRRASSAPVECQSVVQSLSSCCHRGSQIPEGSQ